MISNHSLSTHASASLLQNLLDSSAVAMFSVDREYHYIAFNRSHVRWMRLLYAAQIEPGSRFLDYIPYAEDREITRQNMERALAGEQFTVSNYYGEESSSRLFFEVQYSPLRDESGAILGVNISATDQTELNKAEIAFKDSEELYRTSFMLAAIGVVLIAPTGEFLRVNPAFCAMLGYSEAELLKMSFLDVTHEDDKLRGGSFIQEARAGQAQNTRYDKRYIRKDASILWANVSSTVFRNAAGEFQYIINHVQDISQARKAQQDLLDHQARLDQLVQQKTEQLKTSELLYRSLFDNINSVIVIFDPQTGRILDANPAACSFFETTFEQLVQSAMPDMVSISPDDMGTHAGKVLSGEKIYLEATNHSTSGETRTLGVYPGMIHYKEGPAVLAVIHDITAAKKAEKVLKESEIGLRITIDAIPSLIWSAYPDGKVDYLNLGWLAFTGMTLEKGLGHGWTEALHPEDKPLTRQAWALAVESGSPFEIEQRLRRYDGEYHWFLTRALPIRDSAGKIVKWYGANTDITDRKLAEAETLQSNQQLLKFASQVPGMLYQYKLRPDGSICLPFSTEAIRDLYGCSPEDVREDYEPIRKVILPEDQPRLRAAVAESARTLGPFHIEYRVQIPGQPVRWIGVQSMPEKLPDGSIVWNGFSTDITERKQIEDKLRQHSRAVEASPVSIVITDTNGSIEYINPRFTELTGYTLAEASGQNPRILKTGHTSQSEYKNLWDTILSGKVWKGEFLNRKKNGDNYWESASFSPIMDENGTITHFVAVKEEITQRKHDQQVILDAMAFNQMIIDSSPIGITIYNASGDCISANKAAGVIAGTDPENLLKQNFHKIESWEKTGLYEAAMRVLATGQPASLQVHSTSSFGRELWLNATFVTFKSAEEIHLLFMFEDDSERMQALDELQLFNEKLGKLVSDLENNKKNADLLRQMSDMLQVCGSLEEAFQVIEQYAPHLFPGSNGAVFIADQPTLSMQAVSTWGANLPGGQIFPLDSCWALRQGRIYAQDAASHGLRCKHLDAAFSGSYLDIPLLASSKTLGMLHLEWPQQAEVEKVTQELALIFADHTSLSLSNINLRETLHSQSVRDPLTQTFNRRYLEETLARELPRAKRKNREVGLIMLDIDHFKQFNDTHGHGAGDLVLKTLANLMKSLVRSEDIICRMGGEEFLIILPETNREVTLQRAELIRASTPGLNLEFEDQLLEHITVSLGVAVFPQNGDTADAILQAVDQALYRAKDNGRNRIEEASELEF